MVRRILLAAGSGLALALAFEPYAQAWLIPFAVAGFVLSVRGASIRGAAVPGLAFGIAFWFVLTVWMRTVGPDAWIGMAAFFALFHAVHGSVAAALQRLRGWPVLVACSWVAVEVWRTEFPWSGMPWGRLSFAVVDTPVAPALPYVGSTLVSLALALLGCLLAWVVTAHRARVRRLPALAATGALAVLVCVPALAPWQGTDDGSATVAVVQGDVPGPLGNDILFDFREVTRNHVDATVDLARRVEAGEVPAPDLVIWPENSTAVDPFRDAETNAGITEASAAIGVPLLVGAIVDAGPGQVLNQGIVWDPATGPADRYTKRHPVVFGEFIPFRAQLKDLQIGRLDMVGRDMLAGTRDQPLSVASVSSSGSLLIGDAICFDVAYDDVFYDQVAGGAQLMTVQTSNVSFIGSHQLDQQFAMTRLRAIETGRWVAVASPNGISGIIAPDGRVVEQALQRSTDVMVQQVDLVGGVPPAVRLGAWPGLVAAAVTLLGIAIALLSYRRRSRLDRRESPDRPASRRQPQRVSEPA